MGPTAHTAAPLLWARGALARAGGSGPGRSPAGTMGELLQTLRIFRTNDCHAELLASLLSAATCAAELGCSRSALACAVMACSHPLAGPQVHAALLLPAVDAFALSLRFDEAWSWYRRTRTELKAVRLASPLRAAVHAAAALLHVLTVERDSGLGSVYSTDRPRLRARAASDAHHLQKAVRHAEAGAALDSPYGETLLIIRAKALALAGDAEDALAQLGNAAAAGSAHGVALLLGLAHCERVLGQAQVALQRLLLLRQSLKASEGTCPSVELARTHHELHLCHVALGQPELAARALDAYLALASQARVADRNLLTCLAEALGRDSLAEYCDTASYSGHPWLGPAASTVGSAVAARARDIVHAHPGGSLTPGNLAEQCGVSLRTLQAQLRKEFNMSPSELIRSRRMALAHELLSCTSLPMKTLMARAGYAGLGAFRREFKRTYGVEPAALRTAWTSGRPP